MCVCVCKRVCAAKAKKVMERCVTNRALIRVTSHFGKTKKRVIESTSIRCGSILFPGNKYIPAGSQMPVAEGGGGRVESIRQKRFPDLKTVAE